MHYLIKDTEFEEILKFLVNVPAIHKSDTKKLRNFIEAICYMSRSGCQWRLLPDCYGDFRAIHKRFKSWARRDIWQKLFEFVQKDPDMELTMIDSTIVRAHACAAGYGKNSQTKEALGRSKGGFTTKIHALVEGLGLPLKFILTPGQRNDITQAKALCSELKDTTLNADKAYDADEFIDALTAQNCTPNIPSRSNRKQPREYDEHTYKERHAIECFNGKIKHFRRIFSRYDKSAHSYLAFLHFVGAN